MIYSNSALALMGAGVANDAIGAYWSSKLQKTNLQGQAQLSEINSRIAELGAEQALYQGQRQVGQITLQAGQLKSAQRARLAANGVDLGVGSAAEVQASTDLMKEIDKQTAEDNAVRSAWGYRIEGLNQSGAATIQRNAATTLSPASSAASSLLGGAGTVASRWYALKQQGAA